jgi:hypothetical protein
MHLSEGVALVLLNSPTDRGSALHIECARFRAQTRLFPRCCKPNHAYSITLGRHLSDRGPSDRHRFLVSQRPIDQPSHKPDEHWQTCGSRGRDSGWHMRSRRNQWEILVSGVTMVGWRDPGIPPRVTRNRSRQTDCLVWPGCWSIGSR